MTKQYLAYQKQKAMIRENIREHGKAALQVNPRL